MAIYQHLTHFAGRAVEYWDPQTGIKDPTGVIYRLLLDYEDVRQGKRWVGLFAKFLDDPASAQIPGLVVGDWGMIESEESSAPVVEALAAARDRLPNLRALFIGDIISEESEISWIRQSDVSPLFEAYPELEEFSIRGSDGLSLGELKHERLRSLVIQSGGLGASVVRQVAAAQLPELEHLELWLGDDGYGGDATIDDLMPILSGRMLPKLRYLGLRDSGIADEIAMKIAEAPILERIRILDLSLGTLGDEGAAALLASPAILKLEKLDIHHHFCSEEMARRLEALDIEVDVSDRQVPDEYDGEHWRYVAVSE